MKKNTNVHLSRFFPLSENELGSSLFHKLEICVFRRNHTYSSEFIYLFSIKCRELFSTVSVPISYINLNGSDKNQTREMPLSVILPYFQKSSCFLTVRIQMVYDDSVFQLSSPEGHYPILTLFKIIQAQLAEGEWKQSFVCTIVFPNRDMISTQPLFGLSPRFLDWRSSFLVWEKKSFVAFNPEWLRSKFEAVLYEHNNGMFRFVACGRFEFQLSYESVELRVPVALCAFL